MIGISVIIPTYNREQFVIQALKSVLSQEYGGKVEIIISDDGSTDRTVELIQSFDDRVKLILKPVGHKAQGASGARNRGIEASTQDYICFLDSDDLFLPGHLMKMASVIESEPNLGFGFCRLMEMSISGAMKPWTKAKITTRDILHLNVSKHKVVQTNGFIFRKDVFHNLGGFNENLSHSEDIDMWMRISEQYRGAFSDHFGAVIRKHGSGQLTDVGENSLVNSHISIFFNAIRRYPRNKIKDPYRLIKLIYITSKFNLLRILFFIRNWKLYRSNSQSFLSS